MSSRVPEDGLTSRAAAAQDAYAVLDSPRAGALAIRGGAMRTLAYSGGLLLGVLTAPLLVRHLGDVDFGRYATVVALVTIVAGITEGGVNAVATRALAAAGDERGRERALRDLLGLRVVLSAAGVAVAVGFAQLAGYGGEIVLGTLCAAIGMALNVTQSLLATVLHTRLRFGLASAIELGRGAITAAAIVALVVADAGLLAFLAVVVPIALLSLVVTAAILRDTTLLRPAFHPQRWRRLLRETAVFAVAIAINSMYFRLTLVIMTFAATAQETGEFAISFRVVEVLIGVPAILTAAAFPILSRSAREDRERFAWASGRLFELCLLAGVLLSLSLALAAPFVVEVLTGSSEHPSTDVLRIQALAMIASFVASAAGYPLLSLRRHRAILVANVASLVVVVTLALALTPPLGAQGGAIAAVAADFALAIAVAALLSRHGPRLPFAAVPIALGAGAAAYAAGSLVGVHPLVEAAAAALLFCALLALLRRFPPEVRELLRRRAPVEPAAG